MEGVEYKSHNVEEQIAKEEKIKARCERLKGLLQVMASYGGEEAVDF
jgi:hypothetical protein